MFEVDLESHWVSFFVAMAISSVGFGVGAILGCWLFTL